MITENLENNNYKIQEVILRDTKQVEAFSIGKSSTKKYKQKIIKISQGIAITLELKNQFNTQIILKKKMVGKNNLCNPDKNIFLKMESKNVNFNHIFYIFTKNKNEAEKILTEDLYNNLSKIYDNFNYKKLIIGINNNKIFIFLETSNPIFNPSHIDENLNFVHESKKLISLIASINEFISFEKS